MYKWLKYDCKGKTNIHIYHNVKAVVKNIMNQLLPKSICSVAWRYSWQLL